MYELKVVRERRIGYGRKRHLLQASDVFAAFRDRFAAMDREEFLAVCLDGKGALIGFHQVSVGTLTASLVHPREIFKAAILANAASVILVHNHPSGDPTPSAEDESLTRRIRQAGELVGIKVVDHVVIGDGRFVSFVETERL